MTKRKTVTLPEELVERLESEDNMSGAVRDALQDYYDGDEPDKDADTNGLTDNERKALRILNKRANDTKKGKRIGKGVAESILAQALSIEDDIVVARVLKPLWRKGYLRLVNRKGSFRVFEEPRDRPETAGEWSPVKTRTGDCESKHDLLPSETECPVCGVETETDDATDDEQEGGADSIAIDSTRTKCETPGCTTDLLGRSRVCWECRQQSEGSA
jgi:CRISPR/Cas system-associated protein Cas10 (large subunit of type III CRISPR-Cas system)